MKLSCLQENLSPALGIVGRAAASRTTLPITQNVKLSHRPVAPEAGRDEPGDSDQPVDGRADRRRGRGHGAGPALDRVGQLAARRADRLGDVHRSDGAEDQLRPLRGADQRHRRRGVPADTGGRVRPCREGGPEGAERGDHARRVCRRHRGLPARAHRGAGRAVRRRLHIRGRGRLQARRVQRQAAGAGLRGRQLHSPGPLAAGSQPVAGRLGRSGGVHGDAHQGPGDVQVRKRRVSHPACPGHLPQLQPAHT